MSRIGRLPITVPAGVTIDITNDNVIIVSGKLGILRQPIESNNIKVEKSTLNGQDVVIVTRTSEVKEVKAMHGLYRALIANMIKGVNEGYKKGLVVNGVGYKCSIAGDKLVLNIGFSHAINFTIPSGIKITCPTATEILIEGFDKALVGQVAADIKAFKPVEPYHAYGIRYADEVVVRKEIKKTKKK